MLRPLLTALGSLSLLIAACSPLSQATNAQPNRKLENIVATSNLSPNDNYAFLVGGYSKPTGNKVIALYFCRDPPEQVIDIIESCPAGFMYESYDLQLIKMLSYLRGFGLSPIEARSVVTNLDPPNVIYIKMNGVFFRYANAGQNGSGVYTEDSAEPPEWMIPSQMIPIKDIHQH